MTAQPIGALALRVPAREALEWHSHYGHGLDGHGLDGHGLDGHRGDDLEALAALTGVFLDQSVGDARRGAESTTLAAACSQRVPEVDWIPSADLRRDSPYNLARRVASLTALSKRQAGVLLAPSTASGEPGGSLVADGSPADGVLAMKKLWQTWPLDSVVGDRRRRVFVESERIRRADSSGAYGAAGPLQVPVDRAAQPIVFQEFDGSNRDAIRHADVVLSEARNASQLLAESSRAEPPNQTAESGSVLLATGIDGLESSLEYAAAHPKIRGIVLDADWRSGVRAVRGLLADGRYRPRAGNLREALQVAQPRDLLENAAPAFGAAEERW